MRVYVGQTRSSKLIARLTDLGFGECTQPKEYPPRRRPWFLDNAAFSDWKAGRDFNEDSFLRALISSMEEPIGPDFVACPDRVAAGVGSLEFSKRWIDRSELELRDNWCSKTPRWYLVVQDGMTESDVDSVIDRFAGIFVGGTLPWKLKTGSSWVSYAHARSRPAHIGRVGTAPRVRWAHRIGADSIDSCLPLWSDTNLLRFITAIDPPQMDLFESDRAKRLDE